MIFNLFIALLFGCFDILPPPVAVGAANGAEGGGCLSAGWVQSACFLALVLCFFM